MVLTLTREPIDPATAYSLIAKEHAGSVVFHYAVVKQQSGHGGVTASIEYDSVGDSAAELAEIASELKQNWKLEDLILVRRIGRLGLGDIISLVAASSPNSEDAFASCRHGISRLKKMATIKKQELYE
ncbi:MAG: molybdenum cofactor biosynthesis protein MoaE [Geobacteraceae bacterium]|nr:molybdenum cofactor biosynthesis protein MoaE [Geobacteraceae bacterium]